MNSKKEIVIGMIGSGRGTELHMNAYAKVYGPTLRFKTILVHRPESLEKMQTKFGFENATVCADDLLNDPEIDVIDICTPPYAHTEMIKKALLAGKHVICEKPLTGYFGQPDDIQPIGLKVSKQKMFEALMRELDELEEIVDRTPGKFMYAENFVYAPSVQRAAEIIKAKKSRILYMKGEESLKGSSSPVAGDWNKTGGGTFIRTGTHPLSAILWLKQKEAEAHGSEITVQAVTGEMACVTPALSDYEHRHIAARPNDVEDSGTAIITFSDGTKATVIATDTRLGGSKCDVSAYCNDVALECKLTLSDLLQSYMLDEDGLDGVEISEMLPVKTGWNNPFVVDEVIRGYSAEIQDFMECIAYDREPESGFHLAKDTIKVVYAAYLSAELGRKVTLDE